MYTLFAFALATGGPPMIWSFLIVGVGQFLVALVFSEVVAQYPVAGGVYPWARRLWGRRYAWMTGWVYLVALLVTIASVVYGGGLFIAPSWVSRPPRSTSSRVALRCWSSRRSSTSWGPRSLARRRSSGSRRRSWARWSLAGGCCRPPGAKPGRPLRHLRDRGERQLLPAFAAAALIGIYQYYGFEACGDVAEEVPDPGRLIPKAMRRTIYIGGAAATFVCLALILAVADIPAVIAGEDTDPVSTLLARRSDRSARRCAVVVLISFLSCAMSLQAAASRLAYSYGRDGMIMGSSLLSKFSATRHVPPYALVIAAVVPAVIVIGSRFSTDAITKIISFAALGIYIAFQMVVLGGAAGTAEGLGADREVLAGAVGAAGEHRRAGLRRHRHGQHGVAADPGCAVVRQLDRGAVGVVVIGIGLVYMVVHPLHDRSTAPYDDAIPKTTV